ncbi:MAG: hypothetical protein JO228_15375, partial [Xanthobacteraceae bacterium]|nr:hypothetical protein [Xanthobacteraceae bacterium]
AANGVDLRNFTFSNYAFASPGFHVDGSGNIIAVGGSYIAVGTASPYSPTGYGTATIVGPSGSAVSLQIGPTEYLRHMTNGSIAYALSDNIPYVIGSIFGVNWAQFTATATQVLPTTAATSTTTGALQVAGGAGIAGALYTGGNVSLGGGALDYNITTPSTWTFNAGVAFTTALSASFLTLTKSALGGNAPAGSGDALVLQNLTAAANNAQQNSPNIHLIGQGWKTAGGASQTVDWLITNQPVQGVSAPSTTLIFSSQINGGGYTTNFTLSPTNGITVTGQAATPALFTGQLFTLVGANATPSLSALHAYGAQAGINYYRADGSLGAETILQANDIIGQFTWVGWNGSAYTGSVALVDAQVTNTWVNGADYSTHLRFATTPAGSTAIQVSMSVYGGVIIGGGTSDPGTNNLRVAGGIDVGGPTGGALGAGKINVAGGIYLNNTAYTNPDYVFEKHFTGKIEKFAAPPEGGSPWGNRRRQSYPGRMSLAALERHVAEHLRFPGIDDDPTDIFERADIALEKLEETALYLFELNRRIDAVEARTAPRRLS